eukprot:jgi/Ulvmu1/9609/UM054_0039.1
MTVLRRARITDGQDIVERDFHMWCQIMGMRSEAAYGWLRICKQPKSCFFACTGSQIGYTAIIGVLYIGFVPWPYWPSILPYAVLSVAITIFVSCMYHCGPMFVKCRTGKALIFVIVIALNALMIGQLFMSEQERPFGSQLRSLPAEITVTFLIFVAALTGAVPEAHPAEPYHTLRTPIMDAGIAAIRVANTVTDMRLIQVLLRNEDGCYWHGQRVACSRYILMAGAIGCLASVQLSRIIGLVFIRRLIQQKNRRARRLTIASAAVGLCSELGVVVITTAKLFSDARTATIVSDGYTQSKNFHTDVALTFISLVFSITTSVVSAIGVRKVFTAAASVVHRFSRSLGSAPGALRQRRVEAVDTKGMSRATCFPTQVAADVGEAVEQADDVASERPGTPDADMPACGCSHKDTCLDAYDEVEELQQVAT